MLFSGSLRVALVAALFVALAGCAPSLAPLYSDYELRTQPDAVPEETLRTRIVTALDASGWTLAEAPAPNVVATEAETFSRWGLYKVVARLEVVPFDGDHVRVYVHPYRDYITGGRSKIPYLSSRLRRAVLGDLNERLSEQGLVVLGAPDERDEEAVAAND